MKRLSNKLKTTKAKMNNIQFDQSLYKKITDRELQVARLAREGKSIQQTADVLGIKIATVKSYRSRVMEKLGCCNMLESVVSLIDKGIL